MPNKLPSPSVSNKDALIPPREEVLALLTNCMELAVNQHLTAARDSLKATKIVSEGFGFDLDHIFLQLDEAIMSKPVEVMAEEFLRAATVIKSM